jgi:hypothetical protein
MSFQERTEESIIRSWDSPAVTPLVSGEDLPERPVVSIPGTQLRSRPMMVPQLDFKNRLAFDLATIPEVEAVYASEYSKMVFVWTVVKERSSELYHRIYGIEQTVIEDNPSVAFDFTIMPANGHCPGLLVKDPLAKLVYLRQ